MIAHRLLGGEGLPPCIILHGLLGSSRNWLSAGRLLAQHFEVHALDARNHGESFHSEVMDYDAMANDLYEWARRNVQVPFCLIGHSMGGKTAMRFACSHPERLSRLVIADISVRKADPRWKEEFELMRRMPLESFRSRADADRWLEPHVPDWAFRQFLLTNIKRDADGRLSWQIDLEVLERSLPALFENPLAEGDVFRGPSLWLLCSESRFVDPADYDLMRTYFPMLKKVVIKGAGHNLHFDQTEAFVEAVAKP